MFNNIMSDQKVMMMSVVSYCKLAAKNMNKFTFSGKRHDCLMFTMLPAALKAQKWLVEPDISLPNVKGEDFASLNLLITVKDRGYPIHHLQC